MADSGILVMSVDVWSKMMRPEVSETSSGSVVTVNSIECSLSFPISSSNRFYPNLSRVEI